MAGVAYGLRVQGDVPGLRPADEWAAEVEVHHAPPPPHPAPQRLATTRDAAGGEHLTVDAGPDGYRIAAPGHGTQWLAADGRSAWVDGAGDWRRLLEAQTLPTAAALQGLEVLHAAAAVLAGGAVAVSAPSGTGKSSTVGALVAAGAGFLTDDVLAVQRTDGGVLAHPGPALGDVVPVAAAPLTHVVFLIRTGGPDGDAAPVPEPDPRRLLAATFAPHLRGAERRLAHLDACAAVAAHARLATLRVGADMDAAGAAAAIAAWATRNG